MTASQKMPVQEFHVRDLKTRSVTLYPTKAQVVRELSDIFLHPGANQIVVLGLTPTIDEHSFKVTGTGSATITDLTLELLANKESYDDVYPDDSEEEHPEDVEDSDDEPTKSHLMSQELTKELNQLESLLDDEREKIFSAEKRLVFLDKYGSSASMTDAKPTEVQSFLKIYSDERASIFHQHQTAKAVQNDLQEKKVALQQRRTKMLVKETEIAAKANKMRVKKAQAKARRQVGAEQEKQRVKNERSKFWPKKVFKLTINIDAPSGFTPVGSRRSSSESLVRLPAADSKSLAFDQRTAGTVNINLSLSYITYAAFWSPRYDLNLNSAEGTGILDYSAELQNMTSETWKESKVMLSTSHTAYQGLGETIPTLEPWHLRLIPSSKKPQADAALYSGHEQSQKRSFQRNATVPSMAPRNELFGLASVDAVGKNIFQQGKNNIPNQSHAPPPIVAASRAISSQSSSDPRLGTLKPQVFGHSGPNVAGGALFGMPSGPPPQAYMQRSSRASAFFGNSGPNPCLPVSHIESSEGAEEADEEEGDEHADEVTLNSSNPELAFEKSSFEEIGLTTTYDLPSLKTLIPASVASKHKIVRIDFKDIMFSRVLIPKLKKSVFLEAQIPNASKVTLLRGTASLTLDNSFLGQSSIPHCSAGDSFTLPLGIDPAITVQYAKPTVQRSQSGLFKAETSETYVRTTSITNTKSNAAVGLTVLEQVPVSEDERLRIETNCPYRLRVGGDAVPAGSGITRVDQSRILTARGSDTSVLGKEKDVRSWGSATAVAKKDGEVAWKVKINPSHGCKLVLEYEVTYPAAEIVTNA